MFSIQYLCQQMPNAALMIGYLLYLAWEWALGKTAFGSTIGLLIEHPTLAFARWLNNQRKPPEAK